MSDPIQNIMRALYWAGTRIAISPSGVIELSGKQPPTELTDEIRATKDALLARMQEQEIGKGQDQYIGALPFRYTVPTCCLADKHCRRRGLCPDHLHGHRCGTDEPEDAGQQCTEDDLIERTAQNIMSLTSPQFFELTQELLDASPDGPYFETDTTAWVIALTTLMALAQPEEVAAA
jgi:hypothetical protein